MKKRTIWSAALAVALSLTAGLPQFGAGAAIAATPAEDKLGDEAKFFVFHAGEQSADQFRGDLVYCIEQAYPILSLRDRAPSGGGLLGALLNSRMAEIDRFRMRNAAMRKCMGQYGYARYALPETQWKALVKEGDIVRGNNGRVDPAVVENMVAFATGPVPATERLDP